MLKKYWPAVLALLLAACSASAPQPTSQPLITLPANMTPLVTQVGVVLPANHLEAVKMAGVIRVGTSADYAPFEFLDTNGSHAGFDIDLMEEIAGRLGVRLDWVDFTFKDLVPAVQEGKIDAAISAIGKTPEREQVVDFTEPYYTTEDAFMAAENFTGQITKAEDAAGFTVGVQAGTVQETWVRDNLVKSGAMPEANLLVYSQVDQAFADLKSGKLQLLMADYIAAQDQVQRDTGIKIVYHGIVTGGPLHIAVPKGDAELTQALNKIIEQLQTEGFIQRLALQYISSAK